MHTRTSVVEGLRAFVTDRFGREGSLGLVLVVGLVVVSALGWAFGEITEAVLTGDDLAAVDSPVTGWLVAHRIPWLTRVMRFVTELGSAWFVISLLIVVTGLLVANHQPRSLILLLLLSAAGTTLLVTIIKVLISRPRPTVGDVVAMANGFSFPSGHSAQAVATYGALAWVVSRIVTRRRTQIAAWVAAGVIVLLIGFSRMYLGVHWLSDVIGGYTIGACWLAVVVTAIATTHRVRQRGRATS